MKTLLKKLCLFIVLVIMSTCSAFALQYPETISSVVYLQTIDSLEESYSGTGVIISKDALILTAAHVVIDETTGEPNEYIDICLIEDAYSTPNCQYSGYVFAYDSVLDLALIEIGKELDEDLQEIGDEYISIEEAEALQLPFVDFGDYLPELGEEVTFLGFPYATGSTSVTLTKGLISSFVSNDGVVLEYITDAIINPGNSGGPAYNAEEKVIGIVNLVTTEGIGGNYGVVVSSDIILLWFLDLVENGLLNESFVQEIFSNDQIVDVDNTGNVTEGSETISIFYDIDNNHEYYDAVSYLKNSEIIKGYDDGYFKPENSLNRAELLKILVEGVGISPSESEYKNCFPDVKEDWYAKYICYAKEKNWISGYPDGTFKPSDNINKVEAMKMLIEVFQVELQASTETPYTDVNKDEWYGDYIYTAQDLGILEEMGSTYLPGEYITRGQISENIYRMIPVDERIRYVSAIIESACLQYEYPEWSEEELEAETYVKLEDYGFDTTDPNNIMELTEKYTNDEIAYNQVMNGYMECEAYLDLHINYNETTDTLISSEGGFEIEMADIPVLTIQNIDTDFGEVDFYSLTAFNGETEYMVAYNDYPDELFENKTTEQILEDVVDGFNIGTNIENNEDIELDSYPGKYSQANDGEKYISLNTYLVGNRLYQIAVLNNGSYANNEENYLDSFKLSGLN